MIPATNLTAAVSTGQLIETRINTPKYWTAKLNRLTRLSQLISRIVLVRNTRITTGTLSISIIANHHPRRINKIARNSTIDNITHRIPPSPSRMLELKFNNFVNCSNAKIKNDLSQLKFNRELTALTIAAGIVPPRRCQKKPSTANTMIRKLITQLVIGISPIIGL